MSPWQMPFHKGMASVKKTNSPDEDSLAFRDCLSTIIVPLPSLYILSSFAMGQPTTLQS